MRAGAIEVDPSGYSEEEGVAGQTAPGGPIQLLTEMISNPTKPDSIITLMHECAHAAIADVDDKGYIGSPGFVSDTEDVKLTNAAHFEVVPARIIAKERSIKLAQAFEGQTFVPVVLDKATPGGVTAEARKQASGALELAWQVASNLHTIEFRFTYNSPSLWDSGTGRAKASDYLPFWSKVENLTIHERLPRIRSTVTPGFHEATAPVTEIDLALSEEVVHSLGTAFDNVPEDDAELTKLITEAKLPADVARDRMSTVLKQRDLIIELVCQHRVGGVTSPLGERDLRAVLALAATGKDWTKIRRKRPPSDFAD